MLSLTRIILVSIGKPFFYLFLTATLIANLLTRSLIILITVLFKIIERITSLLKRPRIHFKKVILFRKPRKLIPAPRIALRKVFLILPVIILIISLASLAAIKINSFFDNLPSPERLITRTPLLTTKIYDRNQKLLAKIYRDENRTLVPLEGIPPYLVQATIAIEDKEFYSHEGISLMGILRAIKHNLTHLEDPPIGGSTITQQLVKNALLSSEKTFTRKIKEVILTLLVEARFSKNEIMQMYLNEIPYGGTSYGVEEASQKYFNKHVRELNLAEAALLAGLPKAPTHYSPFGPYPELAKKRQEQVLGEMLQEKFIEAKDWEQAVKTPLKFILQKNVYLAPHFIFYVKDFLTQEYGQKIIEEGGLEITTSLDLEIQEMAEKVVSQEAKKISSLNINNAATIVISPKRGDILAMVGSKDFYDLDNDGNVNVTLRPRQPGSAIKPINYVTALDIGFMASTIISDTAISFQTPGQPTYSPRNYDGQFHGNVSLRTALGSSFNVPAVKVLASYGVERMIETGKKMGITTWEDSSRFGLSLTLGGGEVKMIDLAQAYSVLANLGKKIPLNPILEIKDAKGKIIYQRKEENPEPIIDPGICFILNDILSDNEARKLAFGSHSLLDIPGRKVAVKTGTTNNLKDNWAIGYTPSFLVAAWVGNNNNSPMSYVASGVTGATPIWNRIINNLLDSKADEAWPMPDNVVKRKICATTNTLPCQGCPLIKNEYFLKRNQPNNYCQFEKADKPGG